MCGCATSTDTRFCQDPTSATPKPVAAKPIPRGPSVTTGDPVEPTDLPGLSTSPVRAPASISTKPTKKQLKPTKKPIKKPTSKPTTKKTNKGGKILR